MAATGVLIYVDAERPHKKYIYMKTIAKFGLVALVGAFLTGALSKADTPDIFTRHGLPVPGVYFKNKESQQPATVGVSKSGQGVADQKQTATKHKKTHAH